MIRVITIDLMMKPLCTGGQHRDTGNTATIILLNPMNLDMMIRVITIYSIMEPLCTGGQRRDTENTANSPVN